MGDEFHSKIFSFYDMNGRIIHSIIGSSNFTNGGLSKNIETNIIINEKKLLLEVDSSITQLIKCSRKLQPDILHQYKNRYDNFIENNKNRGSKIKEIIKNKNLSFKASGYLDFWKIADKVKDLVAKESEKEYPLTPKYLVIDHFWHWVVKECDREKLKPLIENPKLRDEKIPTLFKEYCTWDKSTEKYTEEMGKKSGEVQRLLSPQNIEKLNEDEAKKIYCSFHASQNLIQRFKADVKFIEENKIEEIRRSFKHLLDETLPIDLRIHDLGNQKGTHKLKQLGLSCVQELLGWAKPKEMPIRNIKADAAVKLLGFRRNIKKM